MAIGSRRRRQGYLAPCSSCSDLPVLQNRSDLSASASTDASRAKDPGMRHSTQRPLDPRKCPIGIDANALNRDGSERDALVERLLDLDRAGTINLIVPHGVRREVEDPLTPEEVSEPVLSKIFTIPTALTPKERDTRKAIEAGLQGNARPGKHAADAQHLAEAAKYCGYFITHDGRILKRSHGLRLLLPPSLTVVTLAGFLAILDGYKARGHIP
jgi:predicted nucleic acid-binding protein